MVGTWTQEEENRRTCHILLVVDVRARTQSSTAGLFLARILK